MMPDEHDGCGDFISFYREYARSGVHAATAALLTLFGLLSSLADHWVYIGIGVAIYVIPPAYLYATYDGPETDAVNADGVPSGGAKADLPSLSNDQQVEASPELSTAGSDAAEHDPEVTPDESEDSSTTAPVDTTSGQSTGWRWYPCDSPTDANLVDATAVADGAYAVGIGGVVLSRQDESWETLIENGASGDGNDFTAVDSASDGEAVWAVGDSGVVARFDVGNGDYDDLSAPNDLTSTWTGVAVAGSSNKETVYLANGSGAVLRGVMVDGDVRWGQTHKPGSGSSIADLDFPAPQEGVFCDTAGEVFETLDGDAFERIGVDDPGGTLTAIIADDKTPGDDVDVMSDETSSSQGVVVAADDGSLYRRNRTSWTSDRPTDVALFGLATGHGDRLAVGQGGAIFIDSDDEWEAEALPLDATLRSVALLGGGTAVAVGDGGILVERRFSATTEE